MTRSTVPRILTVVGARPQFIKAAPLSLALKARPGLEECILHTGQHYDPEMSDIFFQQMGIPAPHFRLDVGSGSHAQQTAAALTGIEEVLFRQPPDLVVVFGDTNTTLAGALAAVKLHIPVAHVEAGMRSFNRRMPEEINRVVTDHVAHLHFCASETAVRNLEREGIRTGIHLVGDIMADCVRVFGEAADRTVSVEARFGATPKAYVLLTCHRAENTDDPIRLSGILAAVRRIAERLPVIFPAHPRIRAVLPDRPTSPRVLVIPPVGYLEMLALERSAALILTDSGGVQKESLYARVPCVTLRDETEWVETVEAGWNTLAGADPDRIVSAAFDALERNWGEAPYPEGLYGDGFTAQRIADVLARTLAELRAAPGP